MRVQTIYELEFDDWLFHVVLALAAFAAPSNARNALFGVGAAALLLLFIGIHNAERMTRKLPAPQKHNTFQHGHFDSAGFTGDTRCRIVCRVVGF